jgi:hypothetical protein
MRKFFRDIGDEAAFLLSLLIAIPVGLWSGFALFHYTWNMLWNWLVDPDTPSYIIPWWEFPLALTALIIGIAATIGIILAIMTWREDE